ncbi:MAG: ECF-type sigma factor, partial [Planctomycetota bacterium]|jgi:RNA polymerase sigma factor (TIGR02999 family)
MPMVYEQLHAIARHRMAAERPEHTLQATALVHEAYLRLLGNTKLAWTRRAHFYLAAAEAMRRILIEHARKRGRVKRGGEQRRVPLGVVDLAADADSEQIVALDAAIRRFEKEDARAADVLRLRFFAGLSVEETAQALGLSERTVMRDWAYARAWLYRTLEEGNSERGGTGDSR